LYGSNDRIPEDDSSAGRYNSVLRKSMQQACAKSSSVLLPATMIIFAGALSVHILIVIGP
jgi:hypothetical protein